MMESGFENAFMDIQSGLISLCLELVSANVDAIYAYASIEEKSQMFNAFFIVNGEIKTIDQVTTDKNMLRHFLQIGTSDLNKVREACALFVAPLPTEMKLSFDNKTKKFDGEYKYESICNELSGISAGEVFMAWMDKISKGLKS